jgi:hypothetical protein
MIYKMDIHAKLHFNWEINTGKGKSASVEKFEDVWNITKTNDGDKLQIVSPSDDVFELCREEFKTANILFHQYDTSDCKNSIVSLFIDNKKVFVYDVYELFDTNYGEIPKDFGMILHLLHCYRGKKQVPK